MPRSTFLSIVTVLLVHGGLAMAHEGTIIVSIDGDPATIDALGRLTEGAGGAVRSCSRSTRLCVLDFPSSPPASAIRWVAGVEWIELDRPFFTRQPDEPGDPSPLSPLDAERFADFFGTDRCPAAAELELMRVDEVWEHGIDGTDAPVIAVIDTGFFADHRDLLGRIAGQYDYGDLDDVAEIQPAVPIPHHGTFMAGLIAAIPDNGIGRAGIAPYGRLFLQRIVDGRNNQDLSFTIHALSDLVDHHPEVRVVAYSLIPSVISPAYEQAVAALGDAGILFVAAAGNCAFPYCPEADNDVHPLYPQSYPFEHIVTVASSDNSDELNPWTHYGRESVDLFAPGVDLCSLDVAGDTSVDVGSGTSYAAPLVAGAAALVLEAHPGLRTVDLARVLRATAHPLPELGGMVRSGGRLDVAAAVAAAVPWIAWPPNLVVDGRLDFDLSPVSNYGSDGEATMILFHGDQVQVSALDGTFVAEPFAAGERIELPDAGELQAPSAGVVIRGRLGEHTDGTIRLGLRGLVVGRSGATIRMVLTSIEGHLLGAPYQNEGSVVDPSGFEAHPFEIEVRAVAADDLPADEVGNDDPETEVEGCSTVPRPQRLSMSWLTWLLLGSHQVRFGSSR